MNFIGKKYLIYGKGISGLSAQNAVCSRGGEAEVYADEGGSFVPPPECDYAMAIISPGIRHDHRIYGYCAERGIRTMGEAELGFLLAASPITAVTGTNGKTTVTRLIADMTGGIACGNIGFPLTSAVDTGGALICELSSFQLCGAHNIKPNVAVITNIVPDHIDWHGSYEAYCACKRAVAEEMDGGFLVIGDDVPVGALAGLSTKAEIVRCSANTVVDGAYVQNGNFMYMGERICSVDYLRLPGAHNIKNALCAIAAAKLMGADNSDIISAMASAQLSAHRVAEVGRFCGKLWIDDSKSTNIASTLAAIDCTAGRVCLIVGGRNKGLDFSALFGALSEKDRAEKIACVIAMGECADELSACAHKPGINVIIADRLSAAVRLAAEALGDVVLLSPACASFDEFDNYAQRGDVFAAQVRALGICDEK